jgi:hypothetical protein
MRVAAPWVVAAMLALAAWAGAAAPVGTAAGDKPPASPSPSAGPQRLSFLDTALTALRATADGKTEIVHVFIGNAGPDATASIRPVLRTARGRAIEPRSSMAFSIKGGEPAQSVPVVIGLPALEPEDFPLSGWLFLESGGKVVQKAEIKAIAGPRDGRDWLLVRRAFAAAAVSVGLATLVLIGRRGLGVLGRRMGTPAWSFTESWSSTLTIGGAVLTSLLGFTTLPEQGHHFDKKSYALLSLLLAAVIALAPGVYNLFRKPIQSTSPVKYQGIVLMFLLAGLLTMTASLAQLSLVRFLVLDTARAGLMSTGLAGAFGNLCRALQGALWVYAAVSVVQTVLSQVPGGDRPAEGQARPRFDRMAAPRELPEWHVL